LQLFKKTLTVDINATGSRWSS